MICYLVGKEAMKVGVGHFNKMASDHYKNLSQSDKDRLESHSSSLSSVTSSDKVKCATNFLKVIHKKVCIEYFMIFKTFLSGLL